MTFHKSEKLDWSDIRTGNDYDWAYRIKFGLIASQGI